MSLLLIVDDDPAIVSLFRHIFTGSEIEVLAVGSAAEALEFARQRRPDTVVLDVVLPDANGLEVLEQLKTIDRQLPVVIMTRARDSQTAILAMQQGAIDYLVKPVDVGALNKVIRQSLEVRRLMVEPIEIESKVSSSGASLIGSCDGMQEVYKAIGRVASQNLSVLIRGESGTGKELVARAIFQNGPRKHKPFIAINCAAIPEALLESELFGHEKGAFTGADRKRIGKLEQCDGGTLFLDEIGDMSSPLQSKLLRVLQEKRYERVGGTETLTADVRILAATHRDIDVMFEQGKFREDLYYRLNGFTIQLPPLRERQSDLELLIEHFRVTANFELGKQIASVDPEAIRILKTYHWPGNVRQLQSVMHQAVVQSSGSVLIADFLPPAIRISVGASSLGDASPASPIDDPLAPKADAHRRATGRSAGIDRRESGGDGIGGGSGDEGGAGEESVASVIERHLGRHSPTLYDDVIDEVERLLIARVLNESGGNLSESARRLGITRTTLRSKINKLGIGIRRIAE